MAKCLNCGTNMTCGCQKRKASDGKECCSHCLNAYEAQLRVKREAEKKSKGGSSPISFVTAHVKKT